MKILKRILDVLGIDDQILKLLRGHMTIARCKGMNRQFLDSMYALGYQYYEHQHFDLSSKIFRYLCIHDHLEYRYLAGLGASEYRRGRYVEARSSLKASLFLNSDQPNVLLNLSICLIALREYAEAATILSKLVVCEAYTSHKQGADLLLTWIQEHGR